MPNKITRILFPTDFSGNAERAGNHVRMLAEVHGAKIHVLHIRDTVGPPMNLHNAELYRQYEIAVETSAVAGAQSVLQDEPNVVTREVISGVSVTDGIVTYAQKHGCDLIVLGRRGQGSIARILLGSVTEQVCRIAPCPVLVVPTGDTASPDPAVVSPVLVPFDFSEPAHAAASYALELAKLHEAQVTLLHVIDRLSHPASLRDEATARLQNWINENGQGLEVRAQLLEGRAHIGIVETSKELGAAIIVIAPVGLGAGPRQLLGSVASKTLRLARCPVLVARETNSARIGYGVPD